ncbi:MAG: acyl--CoA ligase [Spirochaetales bacterium]|nr:acyl--CoA ligase [Spirochaetales bacterium]
MLIKDILIKNIQVQTKDKIALYYGDQILTYEELFKSVMNHKSNLDGKPELCGNWGILLPNSTDYIIAYFLITFLDNTIVPLNVNEKEKELQATVASCNINLIITNSSIIEKCKNNLSDFASSMSFYNIDTGVLQVSNKTCKQKTEQKPQTENDTVLLLHTSGTGKLSKRVMLTHNNLISNIKSIIQSLKISEKDCSLILLPLQYASANTSQFLAHFYMGASITIMKGPFLPSNVIYLLNKEYITNITCVPYLLLVLFEKLPKEKLANSPLRYVCFGGGPSPIQRIKPIIERFSEIEFIHMYGQTEASTRITHLLGPDSLTKLGSVGKPIPGVEVKILGAQNTIAKTNEKGEIIVRGNNVMKGYYNHNEITSETIKDGWLHTGDIGYKDEDDFIFITGRKRNIIIKAGTNIYPEEIEEVLLYHPQIKEALVYGEYDDDFGEIPVAKVTIKKQTKGTLEKEIISFCKSWLSDFKIPQKIYIVDKLEKTLTGKIIRSKEVLQ